jgi:hypothetical protein
MNYMVDTLYFGRFVISVGITWVYSRVDICGLEGDWGWGFFLEIIIWVMLFYDFLNYRYVMIKETSTSKYRHKIIIIMVKKK